jgi:hypothetical protein
LIILLSNERGNLKRGYHFVNKGIDGMIILKGNLREIRTKCVDWMNLARDTDHKWAVVKRATNFKFTERQGISLTT